MTCYNVLQCFEFMQSFITEFKKNQKHDNSASQVNTEDDLAEMVAKTCW